MNPSPSTVPGPAAPPLPTFKGVLFDLDGVLIDSEPVHELTLQQLSEDFGRRFRPEELGQFKGRPERPIAQTFKQLFPDLTLSEDEIIAKRLDLLKANFHRVRATPGAREFLERARDAGLRLALTTSTARPMQVRACEMFGFSPFFDAVITGDDIHRGKPDPEPYLLTAAKLGLTAAACLVVEDAVSGVLSGKAAGCFVAGLTTSFPEKTLREAGADLVVPSFKALESAVFGERAG